MADALLIAQPREPIGNALRPGTYLRPLSASERESVSSLYHRTYLGTPHEMTEAEARSEIDRTWDGEYGQLLAKATLGVWVGDELAGAILAVQDAPWEDVPRGPFILDLFVHSSHRRRGLGRAMVQAVQDDVDTPIALRVDDSAPEARSLSSTLGFRPIDGAATQ